ncbi:MAG: hypothetical protein IKZ48_04475 [Prevotella sp.]|nr:hypothetical protein [Prevotella sp.]
MKKNAFNLWLLTALVCGLSLSVTSCKDDDNEDNGTNSERVTTEAETEEAVAAYNWLVNMTDIEDFTDDWASKTYEPTIGVESKNETNTRVVVVADIDYAKMNFASISGMSVDQLSTTQSQTIDGVGTLIWTPSAKDANNLATVDVNTKLIPHLSKIVYCTVDQMGENGNPYDGTAYYRFGDVIEDAQGYYWVCVKPAFGTGKAPQQQGYWINILNRDPNNGKSSKGTVPEIPTKNIKDYNPKGTKWDGNTVKLPTLLNSTWEHVHNLSNLVWALLNPEAYKKAVGNNGIGLGGYDYKYNGAKFCERVANQWAQKGIWEKLFNRSYEQMQQMQYLNFFYNGYHWNVGTTAGVWISSTKGYETKFSSSKGADDTLFEMEAKGAGFDIRRYCSDPAQNEACASSGTKGFAPAKQFTGTEGYWVVRQKTSSDIVGMSNISHPSVYDNLKNTAEIYRYNQAYSIMVGSESAVEVEESIDDGVASNAYTDGRGTYMVGDVVEDENECRWICINGSPNFVGTYPTTDHTAWFVSFDQDIYDAPEAYGIVDEDELPEAACRLALFFRSLRTYPRGYSCTLAPNSELGKIGQHILDYAGVDVRKLATLRDSVWTFTNNKDQKQYSSSSTSFFFTMAYNGGNFSREQPIARLVLDNTQAGSERGHCYAKSNKAIDIWRTLLYKHYETYDPDRVTMTDDEASVGMTKWQAVWPLTTDRMCLKDVTSQAMIDKYAKADKWQTHPRTKAESDADFAAYCWSSKDNDFMTSMTSLQNERVLIFRVMKVTDNGGKTPNLVSQDGRRLSVVHLQNDREAYQLLLQCHWVNNYLTLSQFYQTFYVDNKQFVLPELK